MSQWTTWFENNPYINTQQIFMFTILIIFYEKYDNKYQLYNYIWIWLAWLPWEATVQHMSTSKYATK